jgi:hypothetical protein
VRRRFLFALASVGVLLFASAAPAAEATSQDKASAEAMFQDAMKLMADKQYAGACPKLEESQRLDPGMGTQFRLAECYAAVGRTASAWANYLEVADFAKNAGQADRERVARERASSIEGSLSRLTITVTAPDTAGLEVRRAGVQLGKAQWGSSLPVDPGSYEVTASAPGKHAWTGTVSVSGDGASATLVVPSLEDAAPIVTGVPLEPLAPRSVSAAALVTSTPNSRVRPLRTTGFVFSGAGAAGVVVGGVLGVVAIAKVSTAKGECAPTPNDCATNTSPMATRDMQTAGTLGNASTATFIGGGALLVGGVIMAVVGAPKKEASAFHVMPSLMANGAGALWTGSF